MTSMNGSVQTTQLVLTELPEVPFSDGKDFPPEWNYYTQSCNMSVRFVSLAVTLCTLGLTHMVRLHEVPSFTLQIQHTDLELLFQNRAAQARSGQGTKIGLI